MRSRLILCAGLVVALASLAQTPATQPAPQPATPSQSAPAPAQATPQPAAAQAPTPYKAPQAKTREEFDAYKAGAALTNPDQVLAAADQFAQKYPDSELKGLLYVQAMNGFAQQGNGEREIVAGRKAIAIDPHDPNPLIHIASALVETTRQNDLDNEERYDEAAKDAQAAIDNINTGLHIPPNVPEAQVHAAKNGIVALAYETLGVIKMQPLGFCRTNSFPVSDPNCETNYSAAEAYFQKAADASKEQPIARVYLRLSVAQDNEKKYAEALVNANKALQYSEQGSVEQTLAKQQQTRLQKLVGEGAEPSIPAPGATPPPTTTPSNAAPGAANPATIPQQPPQPH